MPKQTPPRPLPCPSREKSQASTVPCSHSVHLSPRPTRWLSILPQFLLVWMISSPLPKRKGAQQRAVYAALRPSAEPLAMPSILTSQTALCRAIVGCHCKLLSRLRPRVRWRHQRHQPPIDNRHGDGAPCLGPCRGHDNADNGIASTERLPALLPLRGPWRQRRPCRALSQRLRRPCCAPTSESERERESRAQSPRTLSPCEEKRETQNRPI